MRRIRHKLGVLYWYTRRKIDIFIHNPKKMYRQYKYFIMGFFCKTKIDYEQINKSDCLIICTHPDDETIFFYSIIQRFKPYVICMSNRGNKERRSEFKRALEHMQIEGVLLNFPDMLDFKWERVRPLLLRKLKKIKRLSPNINIVYTHNNIGESGHHHHFELSRCVQEVFADKEIFLTSQYEIPQEEVENFDDKYFIIKNIYKSQYKMLSQWCPWFEHYMKYEYFERLQSK